MLPARESVAGVLKIVLPTLPATQEKARKLDFLCCCFFLAVALPNPARNSENKVADGYMQKGKNLGGEKFPKNGKLPETNREKRDGVLRLNI